MAGPRVFSVFLSSTYRDQPERRDALIQVILKAGMRPVAMEHMVNHGQLTAEMCEKYLRESDLYLGVLAWAYGSSAPGTDKSYTEFEYELALKLGIDRRLFVIDDEAPMGNPKVELDQGPKRGELMAKLDAFKARFRADPQSYNKYSDDTDLAGTAALALAEWRTAQRAAAGSAPATPSPADLNPRLRRYLDAVQERTSRIRMVGYLSRTRPEHAKKANLSLSDLYVSLQASWRRAAADEDRDDPTNPDRSKHADHRASNDELVLADAFRTARSRGRNTLVLLGQPGSGKTTHLSRMALWCAAGQGAVLDLSPSTIPVLLPLRNLQESDLASGTFEAALERELAELLPSGERPTADELLRCPDLLLLLDGLDEVSKPEHRQLAAQRIHALAQRFPDARLVVSCRFAGYTDDVRLDDRFLELEIRPLTQAQSADVVRRWFRLVETDLDGDTPQIRARAEKTADLLIERLGRRDVRASRIAELAANPLLLAVICLVFKERGGQLPARRVDLYADCVNVLVETWREAKRLPVTLRAAQIRRVLQPMAHFLHSETGRTRAKTKDLKPILEAALERLPETRSLSAYGFLSQIRDESGLLTGFSGDTFGFMHLAFQEFLTAAELKRRVDDELRRTRSSATLDDLAGRIAESWWQEVILLFLALDDPESASNFEPLMERILAQDHFFEQASFLNLCLEDASVRSAAPFRALLERAPGTDERLWRAQVEALNLLQQISKESVSALAPKLRNHPCDAVASRFETPRVEVVGELPRTRVFQRGDLRIETILIPAGEFLMGSPDDELNRDDDEGPVHRVHISHPYGLGKFTVTNEQYRHYLAAHSAAKEPEYWTNGKFNQPNQPVVGISWQEAVEFCRWFGSGAQLPTEAQWEYACRGETTTPYSFEGGPEQLSEYAWFDKNSNDTTHPVGTKKPNPLGLFDMHGNVWEWCSDWKGYYSPEPQRDPVGPASGAGRVYRGGSIGNFAGRCRSAYRSGWHPSSRRDNLGFRVCFPIPATR